MKRIHGFDNEKMRIWLCKDTGTMNRPLRLAECSWGVFVGVRGVFRGRMWIFHRMFVTCSLSVCYIIVIQKYGFWRAKSGFLRCKSMVFVFRMLCYCKSVATHFVVECEYLTAYLPHYSNLLAALLADR